MGDPVIRAIVLSAGAVVLLSLIGWRWRRGREAADNARRRAELARQRGFVQMKQQEIEQLASRIIATSSTGLIAGFAIVRQIEAVFTDGHPSPSKAVEVLKATAAEKGANAVINLHSDRPPSGKCVAYGDAVIVRPAEDEEPTQPSLPPIPPLPRSTERGGSA